MAPSKSATRNVPTLTEVVRPTHAKNMTPLDIERVVEQVMQRLTPKLEGLIHAALQPMVQDQLQALAQLWSLELEAYRTPNSRRCFGRIEGGTSKQAFCELIPHTIFAY